MGSPAYPNATELATLGGGCFWCLEAAYLRLRGVIRVIPGYAGGDVADPTYEAVCSGETGHAEVVQIEFDPQSIGYRELLDVFFTIHDPTTLNRQGADIGTQYRSVIFVHSDDQETIASNMIQELNNGDFFDQPIVTEISRLPTFYPAEAYHWKYYDQNSTQPYCQVVINPKLEKLRHTFRDKLK